MIASDLILGLFSNHHIVVQEIVNLSLNENQTAVPCDVMSLIYVYCADCPGTLTAETIKETIIISPLQIVKDKNLFFL